MSDDFEEPGTAWPPPGSALDLETRRKVPDEIRQFDALFSALAGRPPTDENLKVAVHRVRRDSEEMFKSIVHSQSSDFPGDVDYWARARNFISFRTDPQGYRAREIRRIEEEQRRTDIVEQGRLA